MDVDVDILSLLSKLGHRGFDELGHDGFFPEENPVKTLKAIRRLLNKDAKEDEDFGLESLAGVRSISKHFIPLLISTWDHEDVENIVDEIIKVLVTLTLPGTRWTEAHCNELRIALAEESKASSSPLALMISRVEGALETDASKRSEEDRKRVDLMLYLVRNLLIPSPKQLGRKEFILEMDKESVFAIILHFTNHIERKNNREWDLLLLELYFYLLRGVSADELVRTVVAERRKDKRAVPNPAIKTELALALHAMKQKKKVVAHNMPVRHSHFGGVFKSNDQLGVNAQGGMNDCKVISSSYFGTKDPRKRSESALPKSIAQRKRRVADASVVPMTILNEKSHEALDDDVQMCLKKLVDSLVDKAYGSLVSALIGDIRREDIRFKSDDEIRFVWMVRFFSRYARHRGDWFTTSIAKTMDLWSFQFVVNRVIDHLEQKAWASLETSVGCLLEMVLNLKELREQEEAIKLRNAVFYELRERLEIVPRLLKLWDPASTSVAYFRNLTKLGDVILDILEDMANEGAMAKAKSKAAKKAERKKQAGVFGLSWSAEETFALSEGITARKGEYDMNSMRSILKDPSLAPVFEDQKRTPQQLLARWIQVREALANGKTLEQFVREDLAREEAEEEQDEAQVKVESLQAVEKQVDFFAALRSYLSNNVYRNLSRLADPACHFEDSTAFLRDIESHGLVAKFFRRLRAFQKGLRSGDSLEPLLWHVENFDCWRRCLETFKGMNAQSMTSQSLELVSVLQSSLRRFFRHAQQNKLIFTEILFWRTKQDNVFISRLYNRHQVSSSRGAAQLAGLDEAFLDDDEEELDANIDDEEEPASKDNEYEEDEELEDHAKKTTIPRAGHIHNENHSASMNKQQKRELKSAKKQKKKEAVKKHDRQFKLDTKSLKRAISSALASGVTSDAFVCLVNGLETAATKAGVTDLPFVPWGLIPADDSFSKPEMYRVLLALGMRPPNRNLTDKSRAMFSFETYWRIPSASLSEKELSGLSEAVRDVLTSTADEDQVGQGQSFDYDDDLGWCVSGEEKDAEEDEASGDNNNGSSSDESSSDGDVSEDDVQEDEPIMRAPSPTMNVTKKTKLRRVVSSDDEDDAEGAYGKDDELDKILKEVVVGVSESESVTKQTTNTNSKRRRIVSDDEDD